MLCRTSCFYAAEAQETGWLGRKSLGQGHTVRAQSVREGSERGREIAAPRTDQERGHSGKRTVGQNAPNFPGENASWPHRVGRQG